MTLHNDVIVRTAPDRAFACETVYIAVSEQASPKHTVSVAIASSQLTGSNTIYYINMCN